MEKMRAEELYNVNFIKTVLMLLVIAGHSMCFWGGSWFTCNPSRTVFPLIWVADWLNSFHMSGFVLVSGYLYRYLRYECGKYSNFSTFIKNKAKRLLAPYLFISLIWVIPFSIYFLTYDFIDVVENFAFGMSPGQLWFLLMLFCVFGIFYHLSDFFARKNFLGAVMCLVIYGIGIIGSSFLPNIFQVFRACTYIPLFWLGFKLRQYGSGGIRKIPVLVWLIADVLLFAITQYLSSFDGIIFTLMNFGLEFVLHIVGALMAFVILQKISGKIKWKKSKVFGLLSKNSMPIYLFHQQIIYLFIYLLNGYLNPYIHATLNFVGALLVSLAISFAFMKRKWTRILIGEK